MQVEIAQEAIRGQPLQPGAALTLSAPGHGSVQVRSTMASCEDVYGSWLSYRPYSVPWWWDVPYSPTYHAIDWTPSIPAKAQLPGYHHTVS